jgi:hypothetical protein
MKTIRFAFAMLTVLFLGAGYVANQWQVTAGKAAEFTRQIDSPSIRLLATVVLVGSIALAFVPEKEEDSA